MIWADRLAAVVFVLCAAAIAATDLLHDRILHYDHLDAWEVLELAGGIPALAVVVLGRMIDWVATGRVRGWPGEQN